MPSLSPNRLTRAVIGGIFACVVVASLLALAPGGAEAGAAGNVIALDSSLPSGASSSEVLAAQDLGFTVDIVDDTAWAAMTTDDFAAYEAIILGDPNCSSESTVQAAVDNADVWAAAVDGNQILIGTDPNVHLSGGIDGDGGAALIESGINFALDGSGDTGLFLTLSCYGGTDPDPEPLLAGLGNFVTRDTACDDDIHIVASHPAIAGLTDDKLAAWGCSTHEGFIEWPEDEYLVLALAIVDADPVFEAADGTQGNPYILATGEGLEEIRAVDLDPDEQTHPVGEACTVTVSVQIQDVPQEGADVVVEVTDGPHAGETQTVTTDADGLATFTYTGTAAGTDTLLGTWDNDGTILESLPATCTFTGAAPTTEPPPAPTVPQPPVFTG